MSHLMSKKAATAEATTSTPATASGTIAIRVAIIRMKRGWEMLKSSVTTIFSAPGYFSPAGAPSRRRRMRSYT